MPMMLGELLKEINLLKDKRLPFNLGDYGLRGRLFLWEYYLFQLCNIELRNDENEREKMAAVKPVFEHKLKELYSELKVFIVDQFNFKDDLRAVAALQQRLRKTCVEHLKFAAESNDNQLFHAALSVVDEQHIKLTPKDRRSIFFQKYNYPESTMFDKLKELGFTNPAESKGPHVDEYADSTIRDEYKKNEQIKSKGIEELENLIAHFKTQGNSCFSMGNKVKARRIEEALERARPTKNGKQGKQYSSLKELLDDHIDGKESIREALSYHRHSWKRIYYSLFSRSKPSPTSSQLAFGKLEKGQKSRSYAKK